MAANLGLATIFKWFDGAALTAVPQLTSIEGPDQSVSQVDVTDLDAVGGKQSFAPVLVDGGTIVLNGHYDDSVVLLQKLQTDMMAKTTRTWQITETDAAPGRTKDGSGFVTAFTIRRPLEGKAEFTCTIKVTGAITYA